MIRALAFAALTATPLAAQEQISPDDFLDLAVGRTLTFRGVISGEVVGIEQFLRRDLSVWAGQDGRCTYGRIEVRGPFLCFIYEDYPNPDNCWTTYSDDGALLVVSQTSFQTQRISDVSEKPVLCEGAPVS
ncbi:hypothetical protein KDD17_03820 [Sulfitobacter albidus]|uniref:Uncharacterized protein n=1 Tax=Sulfitobacter albidus TaxID=2829501 RepID=A0A975PMU3_9RHOB|nr:hypothetical protein [Sulfitobacter albidus]QUJ77163.1 hypothetical protein KDD17_03820 [Sulfitobacter albidus]